MKRLTSSQKASLEILLATFFWGFGFVCVVWSMEGLSPSVITFLRFLIAFACGIILNQIFLPQSLKIHLHEFKISLGAGFLIGLTLLLQTYGLLYTTPSKSAFITTLYVVLVPFISFFFLKEVFSLLLFFLVITSFIGTYLLVDVQFNQINVGDVLTFLNALTASLHILYMNQMTKKTHAPFLFNIYQCLWASVFSIPLLFVNPRWDFHLMDYKGFVGLISLALGSSLLGFFLQLRAQKNLSPTKASLLFLLESPIALLFSFWLLHERLSITQWVGVFIIFTSCSLTVLANNKKFLLPLK